jgi:hypothetical protein
MYLYGGVLGIIFYPLGLDIIRTGGGSNGGGFFIGREHQRFTEKTPNGKFAGNRAEGKGLLLEDRSFPKNFSLGKMFR